MSLYDRIDKLHILTMQMGVVVPRKEGHGVLSFSARDAADPKAEPVIHCKILVDLDMRSGRHRDVSAELLYHNTTDKIEIVAQGESVFFFPGSPAHTLIYNLIARHAPEFGEEAILEPTAGTGHIHWEGQDQTYDAITIDWKDVQGLPDDLKSKIEELDLRALMIGITNNERSAIRHIRNEKSTTPRTPKATENPE